MLNRTKLKEILVKKSVNPKLLEMPAVLERIFAKCSFKTSVDIENDDKLTVFENGDFIYDNVIFKLDSDGCVRIGGVIINSYGIEISYEEGSWIDFFESNSREDGKVTFTSGNNGNATYFETVYLDRGTWSLNDCKKDEFLIKKKPDEVYPGLMDKEILLGEFDRNSAEVIEYYPNTAEWYAETRVALEKNIDDYNKKLM